MENNNENNDKIIIESDHYDRQYIDDDYSNEYQDDSLKDIKEPEVETEPEPELEPEMEDNPEKKPKKKFGFYLKWSLIILLILMLLSGIAMCAIAFSWISKAPELDLSNFEYIEPTSVVDKNGDFYQQLQSKEKREIVSIDEIPDHVKYAFIDIEDERFYSHNGVDLQGLTRAGINVITTGSLNGPGGSTITQQLIKLTHLTPEKKLQRKVVEIYLALKLERKWTKDQILQAYLNKVGFANAWGVQAASQTYFRKDVSEISYAQAAVLAATIKSPTYYKPYIVEEVEEGIYAIKKDEDGKIYYNEKNQSRALAVIDKMKEFGHISDEEYNTAKTQLKNSDLDLHEPPETEIYSYFTDELYVQIIQDLMESDQFNFASEQEAENYLLNSGLTIHSTIDPKVQAILDEKFANDSLFPSQSWAAKQASKALSKSLGKEVNYMPQGAMTIIDNSDGSVAGMIGGRTKDESRSLNRATKKFQVGSATKPLTVYAPGLETRAFTLGTTYDDVPLSLYNGKWKPKNSGGSYEGMMTVREGLRKSKNMVAIQAWYDLGLENSIKYGELLGLEFEENDKVPAALSLGGYTKGQSTLAMATAFSTFPNKGTRTEPTMYTKIVDRDGNIVLENKSEKIRVFSEETAYLITDVLKAAVRGGSTNISIPNMEIAGKTGTTNNQNDAYFAGYTPYYTAAVWYGYDQKTIKAGGRTYHLNVGKYGGERTASPSAMWKSVMQEIHKDLKSKRLPGRPGGIVSASIDRVSGKLPTELSSRDPRGSMVISEMFISGTVPTSRDDFHIEQRIDTSTGMMATEFCPDESVESTVRILKPNSRFPNGVKPLYANYVAGPEKDVLAVNTSTLCNIHNATSPVGVQFMLNDTPIDTLSLDIGQSITVKVIGYTINSEIVQTVENLTVTSSSPNVTVKSNGNNTFVVTGVNGGSANLVATITYKGTEKDISYSDTVIVTVNTPSTPPEGETPPENETPPKGETPPEGETPSGSTESDKPAGSETTKETASKKIRRSTKVIAFNSGKHSLTPMFHLMI